MGIQFCVKILQQLPLLSSLTLLALCGDAQPLSICDNLEIRKPLEKFVYSLSSYGIHLSCNSQQTARFGTRFLGRLLVWCARQCGNSFAAKRNWVFLFVLK